jgi:hypothetical protein
MKKIAISLLTMCLLVLAMVACKKEEPETLQAEDFNHAYTVVSSSPQNGQVMGKISASTNKGTLTFSITAQDFNGASVTPNEASGISINAAGEVVLGNVNRIFQTVCNSNKQGKYRATVTVSNGNLSKTIYITLDFWSICV